MSFRSCSHIKSDGVKCNAPALRKQSLCYFHHRWQKRQQRRILLGGPVGLNNNTGIEMPTLESYEDIQIGIMEVLQAIVDGRVSTKHAGLMLYALQIASGNMRMKEKPGIASLKSVTEIEIKEVEVGATASPPVEPGFTIEQSRNWNPAGESNAERERRNAQYEKIDGELYDANHPHDSENLRRKHAAKEREKAAARESTREEDQAKSDALAKLWHLNGAADLSPIRSGV